MEREMEEDLDMAQIRRKMDKLYIESQGVDPNDDKAVENFLGSEFRAQNEMLLSFLNVHEARKARKKYRIITISVLVVVAGTVVFFLAS